MPKVLQINVTANWGSTGRIAENIGKLAIENGWDSTIAFSRGNPNSVSNLIRIGSKADMIIHGFQTRILDNHGLASVSATKSFIKKIQKLDPDIVHLHNIHGYYLNYEILFDFLRKFKRPVIWTFHDCWPITGHCAYFTFSRCDKWQTGCHHCRELNSYPKSIFLDGSERNFIRKKRAFTGVDNMTLVPVSDWLKSQLEKSFLSEYPITTIHNGIDLDVFSKHEDAENQDKMILGVASVWDQRKGLDEFVKLRKLLPENYNITLVGLSKNQIKSLPEGINAIQRTENIQQLVNLYSKATVFVNPTLEDTFPTTNLEALACGTPVITYNTGGSPEAVDANTGIVVDYLNVESLASQIKYVCEERPFSLSSCRNRAERLYNSRDSFKKYIELYHSLI